ncbi:MAG: ferritin-like domain-containing protein [Acetobacteraceae bacterium]|nr:ferritin-like domain-containing protein [Acetobacteraceae bacterium]
MEHDLSPEKPGGLDRRSLMGRVGLGAAGAAAVGALATTGMTLSATPAAAQGVTDADIANFALNLEYLEAEYYNRGVRGYGLTAAEIGTPGMVTGGSKVPFTTSAFMQYAEEIAKDELDHVLFLRSVLGAAAVPEPTLDLKNSFNTLAMVAGLGSSFDPFASQDNFILGAYIFEDVGVTAYHGAAPLVQNKTILLAAAGILGTESYHASLVRTLLFQLGYGPQTQAISTVRAALSQQTSPPDDYGVDQGGTSSIVLTDSNAITFARTPRQVLNIVYGAVNASSGLFFPNGLNGAIR